MTQYSFAVCKKCGVQSPPIINPRDMETRLREMGWHLDTFKFTIVATCPKCRHAEE